MLSCLEKATTAGYFAVWLLDGGAQKRYNGVAQTDRVDRVGNRGFGARPAGQPSVVGASGQHQDRWAVGDLVLELFGDTHAAGRGGLPIEDGQIEPAGV